MESSGRADPETTSRHVRDALRNRNDPHRLAGNPLFQTSDGGGMAYQDAVRLLDHAIAEICPSDQHSQANPAWRRYENIRLRYVEGRPLKEIARAQQISIRQARRDHDAAVRSIASLLLERGAMRTAAVPIGLSDTTDQRSVVRPGLSDLDVELTRLHGIGGTAERKADLRSLLDDAASMVRPLAVEHDVEIVVSAPDTLSPIAINPMLLRHALLVIFSHVVEAPASSRIEVTASEAPRGVELRIGVVNDVPDSPTTEVVASADSTLATIVRLVEEAGGSLRQSDWLRARQLVVSFPAAASATILIVDDNPDLTLLFRRYLRGTGYRPVQATNPAAAIRLASEVRPDVVILDLLLPTQDGWEIFRLLRSHPETRDIPVVICSVIPEQGLAASLGARVFLPKPVTRGDLLAAIGACLPPNRR